MNKQKLTPGNISFLTNLLNSRLQSELFAEIKNIQGEGIAKNFQDNFGKGISALYNSISALNEGKAFNDSKPPYPDRHYANQSGWQLLIQNELLKFNSHGSSSITSVSECLMKTLGLINVHQDSYNKRTLAYYRGHINADWGVESSIGRKIPEEFIPIDRSQVSEFELAALEKWQQKIFNDNELIDEIFSGAQPYDKSDPRWWALKQHYDDDPKTGGSRLIDWTSSPLSGLYFACVDWDGSVNKKIDGGLYVMMSGVGRMFASDQHIKSLPNHYSDFYDCSGSNIKDYFTLTNHLEFPRTVITEDENTRQLAQDGHFIFSPYFDKPITEWAGPKPFFFVIPGECKIPILRELYSLGYTPKKIIRGSKGKVAHKKLKAELGIFE